MRFWLFLISFGLSLPLFAQTPKPPEQPLTGLGGIEAPHKGVLVEYGGSGSQAYWIFEPIDPTPKEAPLIIFNHGWTAINPAIYKAWIDHIVKRGAIVIYPVYQDSLFTSVQEFLPNAVTGVKNALQRLQNDPGHVRPILSQYAIVGHSMGGILSANMAAEYKALDLPMPRAVMCVSPGKTWGLAKWATIHLDDLSLMPESTLLLTVVGDQDRLVKDIDGKRIYREATQVPLRNKNYIVMQTDHYGKPILLADHIAPVAWEAIPRSSVCRLGDGELPDLSKFEVAESDPSKTTHPDRTLNALDYYGTWKLFDALTDAAFYGKNRKYALGNTPEQCFMGTWSDGTPVKPLLIQNP